tara:strand:+ start:35 stop:955 length:921 start_codon:yes stop_codon:yes gene_type:complete
MSRKIVIIPTFASSHFLKCWIPNILEAISPDIIIINEGLFPEGPENKGHIDDDFKNKYCKQPTYPKNYVGFDWSETVDLFYGFDKFCKSLGAIKYADGKTANECFIESISDFNGFEPEIGDIIFPLEPDAFLLETDKYVIQEEISTLKPGEGLKCLWRDFLETQYYCESINESVPKIRRFCYCFDNMENYKKAMDGFMSQSYPNLTYTYKFWVRHYPWFVFDKWKELRYDLIWRSDPQYWEDFEVGLKRIRNTCEMIADYPVKGAMIYPQRILIRPSRQDEGRFAQFIDVEHPKAIKNHPNWVKHF